jgi:Ca2+-binding RTX toxin-like protein
VDGVFTTFGGAGAENLKGGQGSDGFFFGFSGATLLFNTATDKVDGTSGTDDQLGLRGNYSATLTFAADTIKNIDTIALISSQDTRFGAASGTPFNYTIISNDGNLGAGAQLIVNGNGLQTNEAMSFNGSAELDGFFRLIGGAGNDTLTGGAGADTIFGARGGDIMTGGAAADRFVYTAIDQSTTVLGVGQDTITDLGRGADLIDLSAIDANTVLAGDQAFSFIGTAAFSAAGQLRATSAGGSDWLVEADIDGNGIADFAILVTLAGGATPIDATSFIL